MSRIIFALLMALLPVLSLTAGKNSDGMKPQAVFMEKSYDFGNVKENGGPVAHEFVVKNNGNSPLVIISATASCGCTKPKYPQAPIAPGKSAKIKVTYLPKGRPGQFDKTVKVRTNDPGAKKVTLEIHGVVIP